MRALSMIGRTLVSGLIIASLMAPTVATAAAAKQTMTIACGDATITVEVGIAMTLACKNGVMSFGGVSATAPAPTKSTTPLAPDAIAPAPTPAALRPASTPLPKAAAPTSSPEAPIVTSNGPPATPPKLFLAATSMGVGPAQDEEEEPCTPPQAKAGKTNVCKDPCPKGQKFDDGGICKDAINTGNSGDDSAAFMSPRDFYVGTGFAISQTVGARKAQEIKFVTGADGRLMAQIQKEERDIGLMLETHYLLRNQGLWANQGGEKTGFWERAADSLGKIAACGPFSLVGDDGDRAGCGPLFTAILDDKGAISRFGIGWALGLGGKENGKENEDADTKKPASEQKKPRADFGIGVGLLFDRTSKTVDGRLVDKDTMIVRPQYQSDVASGKVSAIVERPTTSVFVMVSKTF